MEKDLGCAGITRRLYDALDLSAGADLAILD